MQNRWCAVLALMLSLPALTMCESRSVEQQHHASPTPSESVTPGEITHARAFWLSRDLLAWQAPSGSEVRLYYSPEGGMLIVPNDGLSGGDYLTLVAEGTVEGSSAEQFRHLAGLPLYRIRMQDLSLVPDILRQQFAVAAVAGDNSTLDATGIQIPGVLDDLYANDLPLGVSYSTPGGDAAVGARQPVVRLWAPTARSVTLHLFADSGSDTPASHVMPMKRDARSGTWSLQGTPEWDRMYYQYEVDVFVPATGQFETSRVTDPYSLNLSMYSTRSQIVDLADDSLKPEGWEQHGGPTPEAPEDIALYELHVRDFSINDATVPEEVRGTFLAFTVEASNGTTHLRALAEAGISHVHLLPAMDCASIPDNRADQLEPADLSGFAPDSEQQQQAIEPIRDRDGFNWCYDPWHYTAPEGTYSTHSGGTERIMEFRHMVMALHQMGLGVVMDVVYNHTPASGLAGSSVLDKIVPGYYQRLDADGAVETSTCCSNTASEHFMMERLMLESLRTWAVEYRVDGFRFDLMGHHSQSNIEKARDMLQSLDVEADGVDGRGIYLYGEGWDFGEVANNARFDQATQINMGNGTGVGTFNDRIRDALRGGEHDDRGIEHVEKQGFINGLYLDPNAENSGSAQERERLLDFTDLVRAGLAGSIAEFSFIDRHGNKVTTAELDYGTQPAGYASDPQEVINYAAAHDNETLFDINQYKLPLTTSPDGRVRVQNLANSVIALSQGIPFFHAGQEILRSKSMDRNSYNSNDWFNLLDFSYSNNGWGRGLPPAWDNEDNWEEAAKRLGDPGLAMGPEQINAALAHFTEMLQIRKSSPLFRLRTAEAIIESVAFHNTGPNQVPGLIVMSLSTTDYIEVVVMFNADIREHSFELDFGGAAFDLHPMQQSSADPVVRSARFDRASQVFTVPPRSTAVFMRTSD
jgi:pullulanase-type alpha-1,6-glucosidase